MFLFWRMFPIVMVIAVVIIWNGRLQDESDRNSKALLVQCAQKEKAHRDVIRGYEFLQEHPQGIPPFTRKVILQSVRDDQRDYRIYQKLLPNCPETSQGGR